MTQWDDLMNECVEFGQKSYNARVVFGGGKRDADIVFLGEAPGKDEERLGLPFVGKAGKNLDDFLKIAGLVRENIYITNVVKIRPFKMSKRGSKSNRPPSKTEIEGFSIFLKRELELVSPKLIVTLGNIALRALHPDKKTSIGATHGKTIENCGLPFCIYPMYHPASVIYNRELLKTYMEDLTNIRSVLETFLSNDVIKS